MSTKSHLKAACVQRNMARLESTSPIHAVVINSGNANCATGEQGSADNENFAAMTASTLGLLSENVLTASTGIIGELMPMDIMKTQYPHFSRGLSDSSAEFAKAILTTDLVMKQADVTLPSGARIVGAAKGSGMIHPNMATMLAFVMTDAAVDPSALRELWTDVVNHSFNQITVDGDTSPNDMAFVLSSGKVDTPLDELKQGLLELCQSLAKKIARDGEGATKLINVEVSGAKSDEEARHAAKTIARSPLVKTAVHGNDPNWGRLLMSLGASEVTFDLNALQIYLQDTLVYHGAPQVFDAEALSAAMDAENVVIRLELQVGEAHATAWGCDLSREYITINADYHT